jgi:hypothetical protein
MSAKNNYYAKVREFATLLIIDFARDAFGSCGKWV